MATATAKGTTESLKEQNRWQRSALRYLGRSRSAQVGLAIVALAITLSLGAPIFAGTDPSAMEPTAILQPPSAEHYFGTDNFGRDLWSRVLYGGRISILVGISVAAATTLTGVLIGTVAGYFSRLDNVLMRAMDILMAFPPILLAIGVMAILGASLINIIIALVIPYTPRAARIVRAEILHLREQDFIQAARSLGMTDFRLITRHLVPNSLTPLLIQQTFIVALAILAESGLNFLGIGVPPAVPTLGNILADARQFLRTSPWMALFPGLFISMLVLGVNLLGDGIRDVLDPRMRR